MSTQPTPTLPEAESARDVSPGAASADPTATPAAPAAPVEQPAANYLDIKLHGITNLPSNWVLESGAPPIYNEHTFRYEVDVAIGDSKHTFKNGRLLQELPMYKTFIENAALEKIDDGQQSAVSAQDVPSEVGEKPPPVVEEKPSTDVDADRPPTHDPTIPLGIMWVLGTDADPVDAAPEGGKKEAKGKKGKDAPPPVEAVKPVAPNFDAPPPCIIRVPLTLKQLAAVEDQVEKFIPLDFVFRRILRPSAPADWEDTAEQRFQATIPVSLKALTEPGSREFTTDIQLEAIPIEPPKEEEKGKKKASSKKPKGGVPQCLSEEVNPDEPHPYEANATTAKVTIGCHKAITRLPQSRPRPDLRPTDMIPKRLSPPQRAVEATKQYSNEVRDLMKKIVVDYRQHLKDVNLDSGSEDARSSFLTFLHTSGHAHAYKQALLPTVQAIVKEKFIRKVNPTPEEMNRVSNELYTYLLDHMHQTMNTTFGPKEQLGTGAAVDSSAADRWSRLAMEAEVMAEFQVAAKYHQERIVQCQPGEGDDQLPDIWAEYAEFCLRVRDVLKAEQGYREALALDFTHLPSLIGYGMLLLSRSRFKEAEVFLQSAVDVDGNGLTWGCVALYYEMMLLTLTDGPEDDANRTSYRREAKYAITQAVRTSNEEDCTPEMAYESLAKHLINLHQEELANICLSKVEGGTSVDLLYAKLFYQTQQLDESVSILRKYLDNGPNQDCDARLLLGDVYVAMGKSVEAEQQYDAALRIDPYCASGPTFIRLGNMYVALGKYKDALSAFIMGAKKWPCGLTWLGVGIAYYRMDDMVRAEQALNESNILNNLNPKTWAFLALVCLRQRREDEGDQAFNQAIKQGLSDAFLVAEIGAEQFRLGRYKIAEACFRRSLTISDDCNTRMHLARTLSAMKRFGEACTEFQYVADNSASDAQRAKAEEQVIMIQSANA